MSNKGKSRKDSKYAEKMEEMVEKKRGHKGDVREDKMENEMDDKAMKRQAQKRKGMIKKYRNMRGIKEG